MLLGAVLAGAVTPYGFSETNLRERFVVTSADHWLGTDQLGRDVLTRILYGARISLYVGFGAVAIASVIATLLGIFSAYWGGRVDILLQRVVDAWMAFPGLLILMSIMSLLGPSVLNISRPPGASTRASSASAACRSAAQCSAMFDQASSTLAAASGRHSSAAHTASGPRPRRRASQPRAPRAWVCRYAEARGAASGFWRKALGLLRFAEAGGECHARRDPW